MCSENELQSHFWMAATVLGHIGFWIIDICFLGLPVISSDFYFLCVKIEKIRMEI